MQKNITKNRNWVILTFLAIFFVTIYAQTPEEKSQYLNSLLKLQQDLHNKLNELRFVT